ncbi:MAG TPA: DUF4350 domain-containing protein [Gammaproteobacteria bacterium]|nr:DUF4350 domain-containing protein [Gammaproteobacteria bacterium]
MRLSDRARIGLFSLGLAAVLAVAFLILFQPVERTGRSGPSLAARQNRFLAAERFLQRAGLDTETRRGRGLLEDLPPPAGVLFLADRGALSDSQRRALDAWMAAGGHLLTVANRLWDEDRNTSGDPFLDAYGVRQFTHGRRAGLCSGTDRATANLPGVPAGLRADFRPRFYLRDDSGLADGHLSGPCGRHLLTYPVGKGRLTVVTGTRPWRNRAIDEGDHAFLLGRLMTLTGPGRVWILRRTDIPGLATLIWRRAPEAAASAAVLLLFALWAAYNRFGPPLPSPRRPRRSLAEHLDAVAGFTVRQGPLSDLADPIRERLDARLERRIPQWRQWAAQRRAAWLADHTGLAEAEVAAAMAETPRSERELVTVIQTLQELEKRL